MSFTLFVLNWPHDHIIRCIILILFIFHHSYSLIIYIHIKLHFHIILRHLTVYYWYAFTVQEEHKLTTCQRCFAHSQSQWSWQFCCKEEETRRLYYLWLPTRTKWNTVFNHRQWKSPVCGWVVLLCWRWDECVKELVLHSAQSNSDYVSTEIWLMLQFFVPCLANHAATHLFGLLTVLSVTWALVE